MAELLGRYLNGNFCTSIYSDGTRERYTDEDEFKPAFAETIDCTLTSRCRMGCKFCYANCTPDGKHADILNQKWLDTLHPYTELAINGNDMDHPDLIPFLEKMRDKKVIVNMTVHQKQFLDNKPLIHVLTDNSLIKGIGISLSNPTDEFIKSVKEFPNAVIHTINGILTKEQVDKMSYKGLNLLILGYKNIGRGKKYINDYPEEVCGNMQWLHDNISDLLGKFTVISFDNNSLEQLEIEQYLTPDEWEEFYSGNEGSCSFFIDAVNHEFSESSLTSEDMRYPMMDSVDAMFKVIQNEYE